MNDSCRLKSNIVHMHVYIRGLQQPGGIFERSIMNIQLLLLLILNIGQMSSTSTEGWKTKTSGYYHLCESSSGGARAE